MGCCDAPGLMPIEDALKKMLSRIQPVQTTLRLPLPEALGYVLAEAILSPIHVHRLITQRWMVMPSVALNLRSKSRCPLQENRLLVNPLQQIGRQ